MTEPQTITSDHVRSLLAAPDSALVLIEGRVEVADAAQLQSEAFAGALEVVSGTDLQDRVGQDPSDDEVAQTAAALTTAAQQIGG